MSDLHKAALAQEPAQPGRHTELKNWSLLAARALDDCQKVIETIVAESSSEEGKLNELDKRVYDLFNQALCLHGLMTRTQLDKVTGFGRVEVTGPIDKLAGQLVETQAAEALIGDLLEALRLIADGDVMGGGPFNHIDTVLAYQNIARRAIEASHGIKQ